MSMLDYRYDKEADAKYITLLPEKQKKGVVVRTEKLSSWLLVDYDKDGNMFGVEILNASVNSVEDVFEELFGDPDYGMELRPEFVRRMKKSMKFSGIKQGAEGKGYFISIDVGINDQFKNTPVVFSNDISENGYGILGQQGFFNHYEINFNYKSREIKIED